MQLKYNRKQSVGNILFKILIKILIAIVLIIASIFLIEKINFPSPEKKYEKDITNDIKKL
tara:strand:+ start:205 stop:384 length:180 start_codon:yes stop_codon:yes gene_type:complete